MKDKVSIIIPCRNEKTYIDQCIRSLLINDYPYKELIVVDGDSTDGTKEIILSYARQFDNVKLLYNTRKITPVALNIGLAEANGEYIMIAGAHASFPENYISAMVNKINDLDNAAAVGGAMITQSENTVVANSIVKVMTDKLGVGNSMFRIGTGKPLKVDALPYGLYRKEVFESIGKYDEQLVRNQDIELSKRISQNGQNLYLVAEVTCYYHFRGNFEHLAGSGFKNGLWNILTVYITKRFSSLSIRHFIPLGFILALFLPVLAALFIHPAFVYISLMTLGIYLIAVLMRSFSLNDQKTSLLYIHYSFLVLHFAYGIGSFLGLFHLNKLFKR